MTINDREKRALILLGICVAAVAIFLLAAPGGGTPAVVGSADTAALAERRLIKVRQLAATVPGEEQRLELVTGELAAREKGILQAETAAQAQAQLLQTLRKLAEAQKIDVRSSELGPVKPLGDHYGTVTVSITFEPSIDQLLNLLADLTRQNELIATDELRINSANDKQKTVLVRMTVAGVVPRKLVSEKKGLAAF